MRQQNVRAGVPPFGVLARERQDLGRGEADGDGPAQGRAQLFGLARRARVAPKARRTQHTSVGVERDAAVLLARDTDAGQALRIDVEGAHDVRDRGRPGVGMLFGGALGQPFDQAVGGTGAAHDLAQRGVQQNALGPLRPDVEPEEQVPRHERAPSRCSIIN